ncbi:hypothetical protein C6T59_16860 [Burkholderia multivorans]|uniref:DUF4268 domain-containing protein n=1 Tax=Burkholderia multivorans TaxID=87883 RepID=A0A2S9MR47_9BURK|nr:MULTISPECIES: hypothetical protein [Burkholderia cepacia complex]MBR7901184.1 hypothetical protein [Burkholderia multivorans]MBR8049395.1 hypothetical protein [Burkholderia multivorans]MBU9147050.1 hypothetical protein [Burkholderia multivorans]MBU9439800.1 hypothetical protein [Burkholderia multivorans]MBU9540562.1 hypothetical protein [Burkholderia multivorans]
MTVFLEEYGTDEGFVEFQRVSLSGGQNESWLQEKLFQHSSLIPMVEMFGQGEAFIPLCREYPLRYGVSNVFLDLLGVSPSGRLVLIECKLWRNPGARREVIAQLFEYASLMSVLTYSDLEAKLKQVRGLTGENPIFKAVCAAFPEIEEGGFVDSVNESLRRGDFLLAIAGDGIRSDLHALRHLLANQGGLLARLALLEIRLFRDARGRTLLVPNVPVQTELVRREVFVGADRAVSPDTTTPSRTDTTAIEREGVEPVSAGESTSKVHNREFWSRFISDIRFDHPDQLPPRHGGNNWVRMDMPGPVGGLVAYRTVDNVAGFTMKFKGPEGRNVMQMLLEDQAAVESEVEQGVRFEIGASTGDDYQVVGMMVVNHKPREGLDVESEQLAWLLKTANLLVNALRPRLANSVA